MHIYRERNSYKGHESTKSETIICNQKTYTAKNVESKQ